MGTILFKNIERLQHRTLIFFYLLVLGSCYFSPRYHNEAEVKSNEQGYNDVEEELEEVPLEFRLST